MSNPTPRFLQKKMPSNETRTAIVAGVLVLSIVIATVFIVRFTKEYDHEMVHAEHEQKSALVVQQEMCENSRLRQALGQRHTIIQTLCDENIHILEDSARLAAVNNALLGIFSFYSGRNLILIFILVALIGLLFIIVKQRVDRFVDPLPHSKND